MKVYYLKNKTNGEVFLGSRGTPFRSKQGAMMSFYSFYKDRGRIDKSVFKVFEGVPKSTTPYSQAKFNDVKNIVNMYYDFVENDI